MQFTFCIPHRCSRQRESCGVYFLYTLKINYIQKVYIKKTGLKFHLLSVYTKYTPNNLFDMSVGLEYTNSIQKVYLCSSWFRKGTHRPLSDELGNSLSRFQLLFEDLKFHDFPWPFRVFRDQSLSICSDSSIIAFFYDYSSDS